MRSILRTIGTIALLLAGLSASAADSKLVLVHYMPWFASKPVSGAWGWHWTMGKMNPESKGADGTLQAASHDRPLIGLYDSGDPAVLECQVLQMKLAGIDGVIIDWYGTKDFNDYAMIHRNTERLIYFLKGAGLRFAICYEDQSLGQMASRGVLKPDAALGQAKEVFTWLDQHWFADDAYLKVDGKPVLLVFGPQYLERAQWDELKKVPSRTPLLITLPHLTDKAGANGPFGWPPVSGGKTLSPEEWRGNLEGLYARSAKGEFVVATAFPGFRDYYKEAGLHDSYGFIDSRGGKTFEETLDMAMKSDSRLIQIATWNDYGEGAVIEPALLNGYRYLEMVQKRQREQNARFKFEPEDLRLPVALHELRKRQAAPAKELDHISGLLLASKCREAQKALARIQKHK